jgi:type IV pilus assembly protein PilN
VLAIGWFHLALLSRISNAKERVVEIEAQISKYDEQVKQVEAYKKKKAEVQQKLDIIATLVRSRSGPVHMLDELAIRIPDRMWVVGMDVLGRTVTFKGKSLDNEILAVFLTQLNESLYFDRVELKKTELEDKGGYKLHAFEVTAMLEDPNAPKPDAAAGGAAPKAPAKPAAAKPAPGKTPRGGAAAGH